MKANNPAVSGEVYRAGPPSPGARLLAAAGLVGRGRVAADIGCDHGKLAVHLVLAGISPRVIAVDNRPLPLARARALAKQTGCEDRVLCRLGDGLGPIASGEAQEIVIAGMSGETMIEILDKCAWSKDPGLHFVFVPAARQSSLRRWLCEQGFALLREQPVCDKRRYYTVLSVVYTGQCFTPTDLFCEVGLVPEAGGEAAKGYLAARLGNLHKQARAPLAPHEREALQKLTGEVKKCLE